VGFGERAGHRPGERLEGRREAGAEAAHRSAFRRQAADARRGTTARPAGQREQRGQIVIVVTGEECADDRQIDQWQEGRGGKMDARPGDPRGMREEPGDGGPAAPSGQVLSAELRVPANAAEAVAALQQITQADLSATWSGGPGRRARAGRAGGAVPVGATFAG
jgi:hypothetical protein